MQKPKIVVTSSMGLSDEQKYRLGNLGEVTFYAEPSSTSEEWIKRCEGSNIICSGKHGLVDKIYDLHDVFLSLPFVAVGWLNKKKLKERNITVSYCPGCNKHAVSEWIISMLLNLMRQFNKLINTEFLENPLGSKGYLGLKGKTITVLGNGNVGTRVSEICHAFEMKVVNFNRGDSLIAKVKDSDVIVNTLSYNSETENLLSKNFFESLKKGSFFITVTSNKIYDTEAMFKAFNQGILSGVADDCASALPGDYKDPYYNKLLKHPKVLATPHISYQSDVSTKISNDMMIENIEAYIRMRPINLL